MKAGIDNVPGLHREPAPCDTVFCRNAMICFGRDDLFELAGRTLCRKVG